MPPKAKPTTVKKPTQKKPAAKAKAKESTAPAKDDDLKKSVKETTTPAEVTPTPLHVNLKQMADILFKDADNKLKDSGKWPLIIDTTTQASTYLRYQNVNYLNSLSSSNMASEAIRLGLLGALRYGKPLVIDMMGVDMFQTISDMMNEVLPGLMDKIMDKSILEEEEYLKLVKPIDGDEYNHNNFSPVRLEDFKFILIISNISPSKELLCKTYPLQVCAN